MRTMFAHSLFLIALLVAADPSAPPLGKLQNLAKPEHVPESLVKSDWSNIRAAYAAGRHAFQPTATGWEAFNPGHQWTTKFDGRGFVAEPQNGAWQWGLELKSCGFAGTECTVDGTPAVQAEGTRLTYQWSTTVQEWFVNDARGLEHGFTIKQRPELREAVDCGSPLGNSEAAGLASLPLLSDDAQVGRMRERDGAVHDPGATRDTQSNFLNLFLAVRGSLIARVAADAQSVLFQDAAGTTVLNYTGLKVWDADGKVLTSHFAPAHGGIRLQVEERGARYPLTIDPIAQQAYLKPAVVGTTQADDIFGASVAVSGDTVVVGASGESSSTTGVNSTPNEMAYGSGAAYVFVRSAGVWTQQAYLKAAVVGTKQVGDRFGLSVAVSGDTVVVGAPGEDSDTTGVNSTANEMAYGSGAAYVFVRSAGVWTQQAYLKPAAVGTTQEHDAFGTSVAVSGDTVVVGAPGESSSTTGVNSTPNEILREGGGFFGAAYVFVRSAGLWTQQAYLKPAAVGTTQENDAFGASVAVSGDTVVVGAAGEDSDTTGVNSTPNDSWSSFNSGAAYVFVRSAGVWTQQAYLKSAAVGTTQERDAFGASVAVSGDTVVVGAHGESSSTTGVNSTPDKKASASGAAYVFVRSAGLWTQQAYLKPAAVGITQGGDFFGAVAVSGDMVVVGASGESSNTTGVNSTPNEGAVASGAAYIFVRSAGLWTQKAYLKPAAVGTKQGNDRFGGSVAVSGDTVVASAAFEDGSATGVNGTPNDTGGQFFDSGAAYVFHIAPSPHPVIFIPGIAGSRLIGNGETGANGNGEYLWPSLGAQDIRALNLLGPVNDVRAVAILREYVTGLLSTVVVYGPLIEYLTGPLGYVEFDLQEHPERMTSNFLLEQTWSQKPTLFTFPYDWRRANASHVTTLRQYISNIRALHDGARVDVIAHSMGGLVLRQYVLAHPEDIGKVVTIGTPFWGSPMAVYRTLTGRFYDEVFDWFTSTDMQATLRSMPSTAELIPPFRLDHISGRTRLLSEERWDLNEDRGDPLQNYSPTQFWDYMNGLFSPLDPYSINANLHTDAQDNWSGDNADISYLHIAGQVTEGGKPMTATDVVAFEVAWMVRTTIQRIQGFRFNHGPGDNTVPFESAIRPSQYLAPNTTFYIVSGGKNVAEHTLMTTNPEVHAQIATFLGHTPPPQLAAAQSLALVPPPTGSRRSVKLYGTSYAQITDAAGNQNSRLSDIAIKKIPGLDIHYEGASGWMEVEGRVATEFTLSNPPETKEIFAEIVEADATGKAVSLTRYRFAPENQGWRLSIVQGRLKLDLDLDRNGTFEPSEEVVPFYQSAGPIDLTPPSITMTLGAVGGEVSVVMNATDDFGSPTIRYAINGGVVHTYSAPLAFPLTGQVELKAYAEDAAGNSTGLIETAVNPHVAVTVGGGNGISLTWPRSGAYFLETATSLEGPWTPVSEVMIHTEFSDSVSVALGSHPKKFFHLRSMPVVK
ncbi:MAG: alpha/beta fold hydrolase [Verrucomicrobiales bacterium]|nr:alpha/beta fold hydrolase [Verrucomicrobiales bacterium]